MYHNGDYDVLSTTFDSKILNARDTYCWASLDGIGPAYFFGISDANIYMIQII